MILRSIVLSSVVCLVSVSSALADMNERGRRIISRLVAPSASKATAATVRITSNYRKVGLGTIVDSNGYILTKASELRKGLLFVTLNDGTKYEAQIVGVDNDTDLALLKINAFDLPAVKFSTPSNKDVGSWVFAAGTENNAVGVISAEVRKLYGLEAEPAKLNKGFLGIRVARELEDTAEGVVIGEVERTGGAYAARMRSGDTILRIGTTAVKRFNDLSKALEDYSPGDVVKVLYKRGEKESEVDVELIGNEQFDRSVMQNKMGGALSSRRTGFPEILMHDTVIAPEDCGGPLVDLEGRVLGINIARAGRVETWALPGTLVTKVYEELKSGKAGASKGIASSD